MQPDRGVEQAVERDVVGFDEHVERKLAGREQLERALEAVVVVDERAGDHELVEQDAVVVEPRRTRCPRRRARASRRASAARAPPPSPGCCRSTPARRRTARRRGRAASPAVSSSSGCDGARTEPFAQRAARVVRLADDDVVDARGTQRGDREEADRARRRSPASACRVVHRRHGVMPCSATAIGSVERGVLRCREPVGDAQQLRRQEWSCTGRTRPASRPRRRRPDRAITHSDGRSATQYSHVPQRGDGPPTTRSPTFQPVTHRRRRRSCRCTRGPRSRPTCPPHSSRKCRSEPQIPQWLTSTSTSFGPDLGQRPVLDPDVPEAHEHRDGHRRSEVVRTRTCARPCGKGRPNLTRASRLATGARDCARIRSTPGGPRERRRRHPRRHPRRRHGRARAGPPTSRSPTGSSATSARASTAPARSTPPVTS